MNSISRDKMIAAFLLMSVMSSGCGDRQTHQEHSTVVHDEALTQALGDGHDEDLHEDEEHLEHDHDEGIEADHEEHITGSTAGSWESFMRLETATAFIQPMELTLNAPGSIIPHPDNAAVVSPFIEASVNRVFVNSGDRVRTGDVMACLISPEIGILRADYDKAQAEFAISQSVLERMKRLHEEDIVSRRVLEESERDLTIARVTLDYTRRRLLSLGLSEEEIGSGESCGHDAAGSSIHVKAPISGTVVLRNARTGEKVDPASTLFELVDSDPVWIKTDVFVKDITKINPGDPVFLRVAAYDSVFTGKVVKIGDTVDIATRTISVIAEAPNRLGLLKPGMFASVEIVTDMLPETLVVPREAVLEDGNVKIVFVREGAGYHRHTVETGIANSSYVQIIRGLKEGDVVVTTGNFQLSSQSQMNAVDPHAGHNH